MLSCSQLQKMCLLYKLFIPKLVLEDFENTFFYYSSLFIIINFITTISISCIYHCVLLIFSMIELFV